MAWVQAQIFVGLLVSMFAPSYAGLYIEKFKEIQKYCPGHDFCTSQPAEILLGSQPVTCCPNCSCSPDCYLTASCCPDARLNATRQSWCYEVGRHLNYLRINFRTYMHILNVRRKQSLIGSCPSGGDERLADLCRNRRDFVGYTIVSSSSTGDVFVNKYCAECNGIEDYIEWHVFAFNCPELYTFYSQNTGTFNMRDLFIVNSCDLVALPPGDDREGCLQDQVKIIEYTKDCVWGKNDLTRDVAKPFCMSFSGEARSLYVYNDTGEQQMKFVHRNCYMCDNFDSDYDKCTPTDTSWPVLIAFDRNYDVDIVRTYNECVSWAIYDVILGRCKNVHCQEGTLPLYGECVYPFSHIVGATLEIWFTIELSSGNKLAVQQPRFVLHASALNKIEMELTDRLGGKCLTCASELLKTTDDKYILKMITQTTDTCKIAKLVKQLNKMVFEEIRYNVTLFGSSSIAKLKLIISEFPVPYTVVSSLNSKPDCFKHMTFDETFGAYDCPKILLTSRELERLGFVDFNGTIEEIDFDNDFNETLAQRQMICLDDYRKQVEGKSLSIDTMDSFVHSYTSGQSHLRKELVLAIWLGFQCYCFNII